MASAVFETKEGAYLADFAQRETSLPGAGLPWLQTIRRAGLSRFKELGFPTMRLEEWRFTDVGAIAETEFSPAAPVSVTAKDLESFPFTGRRLVFVNGFFMPELSSVGSVDGVRLGNLASLLTAPLPHPLPRAGEGNIKGEGLKKETFEKDSLSRGTGEGGPKDRERGQQDFPESFLESHLAQIAPIDKHSFTALNNALFTDGAYVFLSKGAVVQEPIQLLFVSKGSAFAAHPRVLVAAEEGSQASIVESYLGLGAGTYFTNAVTEVSLGESAQVTYTKIQRENPGAYHVATFQAVQGRNSRLISHNISLGGLLARNDINSSLSAEGAECHLNGLYLAAGRQHVDNHTTIDHVKPHGTSRELYKGILGGKAKGIFDGEIIVRPDAQKTDSVQTNKNLLVSREALVNTKPELRISANDVKCKHGATIGQLNADALFYLRARGVPHGMARRLLTPAFAREIIDGLQPEALRDALAQWVTEWLPEE